MAGGFPNVTIGYVGTPAVDLLMASRLRNEKVLNVDLETRLWIGVESVEKNNTHTSTSHNSQFRIPNPHFCNVEVFHYFSYL